MNIVEELAEAQKQSVLIKAEFVVRDYTIAESVSIYVIEGLETLAEVLDKAHREGQRITVSPVGRILIDWRK